MTVAPPPKSSGPTFRDLISSPYLQGILALVSLIVAAVSDNPLLRTLLVLVVLLGVLVGLRTVIWSWVRRMWMWLTWKFVLGVALGIIAGPLLTPSLQSASWFGSYFPLPQVEVVDSTPKSGGTLSNLSSQVTVNFSELIPSQYRSSSFVKVEITPDIPIRLIWIYMFDPSECCRTLDIEPNNYFPNANTPQFEPSKIYHLRISGPLLKNPADIEFHTPPQ
jgi:hypothetical protein